MRETLLTVGLIAACLGFTGFNVAPKLNISQTATVQTTPDITVSISGYVQVPGTYTLPWGARVEDLLKLAGGLREGADKNLINLAEQLDTGSAVFVPSSVSDAGFERISINSASAGMLETLPRIGPAMAQRIIDARPFNTVDDLLDVKGIGPKTLDKLLPVVTL